MMLIGGVVQLTQAGLSCPDWPVCYAQGGLEKNVLLSNLHRLLGLVIFVVNSVLLLKFKAGSELRKLANFSMIFLLIQAGLGALTAIYKLPTITSLSHFILSIVYICLLINIKYKQRDDLFSAEQKLLLKSAYKPIFRHVTLFSFSLVLIQSFLGVIINKSGAGKACKLGVENIWNCIEVGSSSLSFWPTLAPSQLNLVHRALGSINILIMIIIGTIVVSFARNKLLRASLKSTFKYGIGVLAVAYALFYSAKGVIGFEQRELYIFCHYSLAILSLMVLWSLNKILESIEMQVYPEGAHTFLSDLVMLTKPKLAGLVMVTVAVGILLAPASINFFYGVFSFLLIHLVVMGAAVLNCYIERDVDGLMERTKDRPLPSGRMKPSTCLIFGSLCLIVSLPLIYFYINPATAYLSFVAAALYLWAYTPLKQISPSAVYVGAIPGAIPPVLGWTIVMGEMNTMAWVLFWILFVWQLPHFLAISIYHAQDYGAASIKVYPNQNGYVLTKWGIALFTITLAVVAFLPFYYGFASKEFAYFSVILNALFVALSFLGFKYSDEEEIKKWARLYFLASVFYLPMLLGAIIFFR